MVAHSHPDAPLGRRKPRRLLILEDDLLLGKALQRSLEREFSGGAAVAGSVREARSLLEMVDFYAVLSDVEVIGPETGIDLYREVQRKWPELASRWVFCSGHHGDFPEGVQVLRKPVSPSEVRRALLRF